MKNPLLVAILSACLVAALPGATFAMTQAERIEKATQARQAAEARAAERKIELADRKAEVRERVEAKKAEIDAAKCERNQARINAMMPRLAQSATSQQRVLDTMYERVVAFYEKGTLSAENYEELVADVETAKIETTEVLQLVRDSEVEVDCERDGMGEQLALYREAVGEVRTQLKDYRGALVDLIKSMNAAADDTDQSDYSTSSEPEAASDDAPESEDESSNESEPSNV